MTSPNQFILPLDEVWCYLAKVTILNNNYEDNSIGSFSYYQDIRHAIEDSVRILITRNVSELYDDRLRLITRFMAEEVYEGNSWDYYQNHQEWTELNLESNHTIFNRMVASAIQDVQELDSIVTDVLNGIYGNQWRWPAGKDPIITWLTQESRLMSIVV